MLFFFFPPPPYSLPYACALPPWSGIGRLLTPRKREEGRRRKRKLEIVAGIPFLYKYEREGGCGGRVRLKAEARSKAIIPHHGANNNLVFSGHISVAVVFLAMGHSRLPGSYCLQIGGHAFYIVYLLPVYLLPVYFYFIVFPFFFVVFVFICLVFILLYWFFWLLFLLFGYFFEAFLLIFFMLLSFFFFLSVAFLLIFSPPLFPPVCALPPWSDSGKLLTPRKREEGRRRKRKLEIVAGIPFLYKYEREGGVGDR